VTVVTVSVSFRFLSWLGWEAQVLVSLGALSTVAMLAFLAGYVPLKLGIRAFEKAEF
jgi:hypothetical protein